MNGVVVGAVDLGAASGRVIAARVGRDLLELTEVARFANVPVPVAGTLYWDVLALYRGVLDGLRAAGPLDSAGIDSWAVDYGLLDADGALLGNPVHYRDSRTDGMVEKLADRVGADELYRLTGIQQQPFNTAVQLLAASGTAAMAAARTVLLLPDLLGYWLTGQFGAELTNASTTQLVDVHTRQWSMDLMRRLDISPSLFPPVRMPGEPAGEAPPDVTGLDAPLPVTVVASHDTACAVAAVPASGRRFAYLSCGTWSLVGVELDRPVLTEASRAANFTNEAGVDGTIRYLRNVMGLWLLQECLRVWREADLDRLLREAAAVPAFRALVDPDDPAFLPPGDMPARIAQVCRRTGQPAPASRAETVRCVLDSLALAHRAAVHDAQRLSGTAVDVLHMVGGGTRNTLLCQLTADACGLPVEAGPEEATALGNALVQARALGAVGPDLAALRALVRATQPIRRYQPAGDPRAWTSAAARLAELRDR